MKKLLFNWFCAGLTLLLLAGSGLSTLSAQTTSSTPPLTGVVVDKDGNPMVGVAVIVEGTSRGTTTNVDGKFSIAASASQALRINMLGYAEQRIEVGSQTHIKVTLVEDAQMIDDVVVEIGYGNQRLVDVSGALSRVNMDDIVKAPVASFDQALQGRMAGVSVTSSDGQPGTEMDIVIRGANSLTQSNSPLYVIDGFPIEDFSSAAVNAADIASMTVLKDASATAIYGSRGANGVVIITTKRGRAGESKLTLDMSLGWSNATHLPDVLNARDYAKALVQYDGIPEAEVKNYLDGSDPGTDWKDEVFKTGMIQNYKVVFNKGTEDTQLYVSGNYMRHEGVMKDTQYERYAARLNVNSNIFSWLNINADVNLSHGEGKGIGGMALGGYNPVYLALNYSPTMHVKNDLGEYLKDPYCSINESPLASLTGANQRRADVLNGHFDLRFNILPGLTFTSSNGIDYYNYYGYGFSSSKRWPGAATSMSNNNTNRWLLQSSNNFTYINTFGEKHNLTATAVWEATKSNTRGMGISGSDLVSESVEWYNVSAAASRDASNSYSEWSLLSGVGRVIYNFDNRYMITGTLRADGSSRLSQNKWCWFPSVAVAWTASNESFFEPLKPTINNLKLRTSYGVIGNQDIAPFSTLALMSQTSTYYGNNTGVTGYWANKTPTPDLRWEKTKQFDLGLDFSMFNSRLDVSIDWYYKRTSDALLNATNPGYLGGQSYLVNAGEVSNTGFDFAINAGVIQSGDWNWNTSINASILRNRVEKMTTAEPILYSGSMMSIISDGSIIKEGEAIGSLYGFRWAGIDSEGYDTYYDADGNTTRNPTLEDRCVLGKATPSFTLGWNNTVTWRNWSLNAFFNSAFGAKRLNVLRFAMCSMIGNSRMFTSPDALSGMGKDMPDPTVSNNQYIGNSTKWLEKADYFRLENITLGYDLKKETTRFADVHLSFSVQNLFTITGYKGINPASYSFGDAKEWQQGIDTGTNPCPRTFTFGARFTF